MVFLADQFYLNRYFLPLWHVVPGIQCRRDKNISNAVHESIPTSRRQTSSLFTSMFKELKPGATKNQHQLIVRVGLMNLKPPEITRQYHN